MNSGEREREIREFVEYVAICPWCGDMLECSKDCTISGVEKTEIEKARALLKKLDADAALRTAGEGVGLREALEIAAKWFDEYAVNHRISGKDAKADTNEFRARFCRKAARPAQEPASVDGPDTLQADEILGKDHYNSKDSHPRKQAQEPAPAWLYFRATQLRIALQTLYDSIPDCEGGELGKACSMARKTLDAISQESLKEAPEPAAQGREWTCTECGGHPPDSEVGGIEGCLYHKACDGHQCGPVESTGGTDKEAHDEA
jgi:hypothetical protein